MPVPKLKNYRLTHDAVTDMGRIYDYTFDTWGETQAEKYWIQLHAAFEKLLKNPARGKNRDGFSAKFLFFHAEHHMIVYHIAEDHLEIIRVLHERMDAQRHLH